MLEQRIAQSKIAASDRLASFDIQERHQDAFERISAILRPHATELATVYLEHFWKGMDIHLSPEKRGEQIAKTASYSASKYTPPIDAEWIARTESMGRLQFKLRAAHNVHLGALNRSHRRSAELIFADAADTVEGTYLVEQFMRLAALEAEIMVSTVQREQNAQHAEQLAQNARDFQTSITGIVDAAKQDSSVAHQKADRVSQATDDLLRLANAVAAGAIQSTDAMAEAARMSAGLDQTIKLIDRDLETTFNDLIELSKTAESTIESARQFAAHEKSIERIVAMIREVADDTSILALNAIIEAADAGEKSAGFTVVANEMKELANQTARATGEISDQLSGISKASQVLMEAHQEMGRKYLSLRDKAGSMRGTMSEQASSVSAIASCIDETSLSARSSAQNIQEINQRTASVSQDIEDVTAGVGELDKRLQDLRLSADAFLAELQH